MAEDTKPGTQQPPGRPDPLQGASAEAREAAEAAANGKPENAPAGGEEALLGFLLGDTPPIVFDCEVKIALPPNGKDAEVVWELVQMDGADIDKIETANMPNGPMGEANDLRINAELTTAASIAWVLPSGRRIDPRSEEFRRGVADPVDAMVRTFRYQQGILSGVAQEIRRISGWTNDRVGKAQAKPVAALGGS